MHHININNVISFIASQAVVDIHYHKCYQVVISLDQPFNSIIDKREYRNLRGFIVNQNITHSCKAGHTSVLIYFIDAESYFGWQLKVMMDGRPFLDIESVMEAQELDNLADQLRRFPGLDEMRRIADDFLEGILPPQKEQDAQMMDQRVIKVMTYIDARIYDPIALDEISAQIFLSPERVRHLFAQETGISFSQYVLWKRIKAVLTQVIKHNTPMVNAALQNGFTDHAHFARLFKRTFGVSAKHILKNSRFIQFLVP